jgi:hypothetical protein
MARILIHIPSRGRPDELLAAVDNFAACIEDRENTGIQISQDYDDPTLDPLWVDPPTLVWRVLGDSKSKVAAINRDLDRGPWDVLVCASDDLSPMAKGFDQAIRTDFANDADDFDAVMWYPDKNHRICCHPVIGRKYYERDGYVFHPSYRAFYCDDELTMVAQKRGKLFKSTAVEWDHRHPNYRSRKPDGLDHRNKEFMRQDYLTFCRRQSEGFPK